MRVWIDIANSPHVGLFDPVVKHMRTRGWDVLLTARDHAQTAELASARWPDVRLVGGESPHGRVAKARAIVMRATELAGPRVRSIPTSRLSHGSYAQVMAARLLGVPAVTMMDYEYQPANHVSFRLAARVIVPNVFPARQLRRFGARPEGVRRLRGLQGGAVPRRFRAVGRRSGRFGTRCFANDRRAAPTAERCAVYRGGNEQFDRLVERLAERSDTQAVLLARNTTQRSRYAADSGLVVPDRAIEALGLVAHADAVIGAGGTMNREAALLGAPTYTLFAGRLAAVDARLVALGYMYDLRTGGLPVIEKRRSNGMHASRARSSALLELIVGTVRELAGAP